MNWTAALGGFNQGFTQGQNDAHQMYMNKMESYGAPYKAYGDAMENLYRGYDSPIKHGQLQNQLDTSMLDYRNKLYAEPLYRQNIRNDAMKAGVAQSSMYAVPGSPLNMTPAQLQMYTGYGISNDQLPTGYNNASGIEQQMYANTMQAKNQQYNAQNYPMPMQQTTVTSGGAPSAPMWNVMGTPPAQPMRNVMGTPPAPAQSAQLPYNAGLPGMMQNAPNGADPYAPMRTQVEAASLGARNPPISPTASPYVVQSMTAAQNPYAAPANSPVSQNYYASGQPTGKSTKTTYKAVKPTRAARLNRAAKGN